MLLNLKCPSCGHAQRASDAILGKVLLCSSCGGSFRVAVPRPGPTPLPPCPISRIRPAAIPADGTEGRLDTVHRHGPLPDSIRRDPGIPAIRGPRGTAVCPPGSTRSSAAPRSWASSRWSSCSARSAAPVADGLRTRRMPAEPGGVRGGIAAGPRPSERAPVAAGDTPLSTAQIVARGEPSVALIKGKSPAGPASSSARAWSRPMPT